MTSVSKSGRKSTLCMAKVKHVRTRGKDHSTERRKIIPSTPPSSFTSIAGSYHSPLRHGVLYSSFSISIPVGGIFKYNSLKKNKTLNQAFGLDLVLA